MKDAATAYTGHLTSLVRSLVSIESYIAGENLRMCSINSGESGLLLEG